MKTVSKNLSEIDVIESLSFNGHLQV